MKEQDNIKRVFLIRVIDKGLSKRKAHIAVIKDRKYKIIQKKQNLFRTNKEMLNIIREARAEIIVKKIRLKAIRFGESDHPKRSKVHKIIMIK